MTDVELRIDARWVLPIEPAGLLHQHSLLVREGRIVAIAPTALAERDYAAREHVALATHVLLPGLVNAHTHAAMSLLRGVADDLPLKAWLEQSIWPREGRFVDADFVYDGTLLAAAEMVQGGITCCNDMYFFPDAAARAYRASGMRAMLGLPILDFATPYAADADGYLHAGLAARDAWKHEPRLLFSFAPHAPYTVADATWTKIVIFARQLDLAIQTHLLETSGERTRSLAEHHLAPLQRLHRLGVTGPGFIAIHAVDVDPTDIELLATQRCHVVHCPTSNLRLGAGIAPVRELGAAGIAVGLGVDGSASNERGDLLLEVKQALLVARARGGPASTSRWAATARRATIVSTCSPRHGWLRSSPRSPAMMLLRCLPPTCCGWQRWAARRRWGWKTTSDRSSPASRPTSSRST